MAINVPTLQFLRGQIGMPLPSSANARGSWLDAGAELSLGPNLALGLGDRFGFGGGLGASTGFDPFAAFSSGAQTLFPNFGGYQKIPGLSGIFSIAAPNMGDALGLGNILHVDSLTEGVNGPFGLRYPVGTLGAIGNPQPLIDLFSGVSAAEVEVERGRAARLAMSQMPGGFPTGFGSPMNAGNLGNRSPAAAHHGGAAAAPNAPSAIDNNAATPPPAPLDAASVQAQLQSAGYSIGDEAVRLTNMIMAKADESARVDLLAQLKKCKEEKDPKECYKKSASAVLDAYVDTKTLGNDAANKLFSGALPVKNGDIDPSKGLGVFIGRLLYLKGLVDAGKGVESPEFNSAVAGYRSQS